MTDTERGVLGRDPRRLYWGWRCADGRLRSSWWCDVCGSEVEKNEMGRNGWIVASCT
jgi:hypothetical protein